MGEANHNQSQISVRVGLQPHSELVVSVSPLQILPVRETLQPLANAILIYFSSICRDSAFQPAKPAALSGVRDSPMVMEAEIQYLLIGDTS